MDETSSTRTKRSVATSAGTGSARQDLSARLDIGNARAAGKGGEALARKAEPGLTGKDTPARPFDSASASADLHLDERPRPDPGMDSGSGAGMTEGMAVMLRAGHKRVYQAPHPPARSFDGAQGERPLRLGDGFLDGGDGRGLMGQQVRLN